MPLFSPEEIEEICNSVSLIDYFRDLDRRGIVRYDRKLQMINIMILKQVKEEKSLKPSWKWKIKIGERP